MSTEIDAEQPAKKIPKLTDKQKRWADEYMRTHSKTEAGMLFTQNRPSAAQMGYSMYKKPQVKRYIADRMAELAMGPEEALKRVANIALGNAADYLTVRMVERTPRVKMKLSDLIKQLNDAILFEEEWADICDLTAKEKRMHKANITAMQQQLERYSLELQRNPKATKIVNGETELVPQPELDLVKIMEDKERGIIKSIARTEFGHKIEMYPADAALVNILRVAGSFAKDNQQLNPPAAAMDDDQFIKALNAARAAAALT